MAHWESMRSGKREDWMRDVYYYNDIDMASDYNGHNPVYIIIIICHCWCVLMCPLIGEYPHSGVQIMWPYPPLFTIFWCSTLGEKHIIIYIYVLYCWCVFHNGNNDSWWIMNIYICILSYGQWVVMIVESLYTVMIKT